MAIKKSSHCLLRNRKLSQANRNKWWSPPLWHNTFLIPVRLWGWRGYTRGGERSWRGRYRCLFSWTVTNMLAVSVVSYSVQGISTSLLCTITAWHFNCQMFNFPLAIYMISFCLTFCTVFILLFKEPMILIEKFVKGQNVSLIRENCAAFMSVS